MVLALQIQIASVSSVFPSQTVLFHAVLHDFVAPCCARARPRRPKPCLLFSEADTRDTEPKLKTTGGGVSLSTDVDAPRKGVCMLFACALPRPYVCMYVYMAVLVGCFHYRPFLFHPPWELTPVKRAAVVGTRLRPDVLAHTSQERRPARLPASLPALFRSWFLVEK